MVVILLQHTCPKQTVHHLGRTDTALILPVVRGTRNRNPPLAQAHDVVELAIPGSS